MPCSIHPQWMHDASDCPMCSSKHEPITDNIVAKYLMLIADEQKRLAEVQSKTLDVLAELITIVKDISRLSDLRDASLRDKDHRA